MRVGILIVLMAVILYVAFRFFKTKGNSTYNDINFNNSIPEEEDKDSSPADYNDSDGDSNSKIE